MVPVPFGNVGLVDQMLLLDVTKLAYVKISAAFCRILQ